MLEPLYFILTFFSFTSFIFLNDKKTYEKGSSSLIVLITKDLVGVLE